ncbi:Protein of unknown function [Pseudonocardia thermophila]|uniref:DUF1360 domain-containing protein n=1 Tax=Pseudonocardia thermophila TaxID=1848 RepID=A0A1M7AYB8_PSETH|nr:DUF1360 domain-containing protein [Pseudonocardia thermophila]SHL47750.1 Protein of unknown function [Pseudonocardia thermophila]
MTATETLVDALAVARLTRLLQHDEVWPVRELRERFERWAGDTRWADLASCEWCLSIWVAAGVAVARRRMPRLWPIVARVLVGSAVTGYVERLV